MTKFMNKGAGWAKARSAVPTAYPRSPFKSVGTLRFAHPAGGAVTIAVIVREGGRSSIPETVVINREAAAYWITRLRG